MTLWTKIILCSWVAFRSDFCYELTPCHASQLYTLVSWVMWVVASAVKLSHGREQTHAMRRYVIRPVSWEYPELHCLVWIRVEAFLLFVIHGISQYCVAKSLMVIITIRIIHIGCTETKAILMDEIYEMCTSVHDVWSIYSRTCFLFLEASIKMVVWNVSSE